VTWVPIVAWCVAAALALVVLGYCAYEIIWKTKRLQRDARQLQVLADRLTELRGELAEIQQRVAAGRSR
jgi:hypothetical protein